MTELFRQPVIGFRLFHRVQILALNIFDQRNLKRFAVLEIADDHGDLVKSRTLCCAPTPLASDNLIAASARSRSHDNRLNDPALSYARCELVQRSLREVATGLIRMRFERGRRQRTDRARARVFAILTWPPAHRIAQKTVEPAAQTTFPVTRCTHAAISSFGRRSINSRARSI